MRPYPTRPALLLASSLTALHAQSSSIGWYKIAGGGGTSSSGQYSLTGTIGQHDAGSPMTGGNYSLTGGFWSLFAVQTPGAPLLSIQLTGPGVAVVSWPAPATGFVLQQNGDLNTANCLGVTNAVTVVNGQNQATVTPLPGNRFYRLLHPSACGTQALPIGAAANEIFTEKSQLVAKVKGFVVSIHQFHTPFLPDQAAEFVRLICLLIFLAKHSPS